MWLVLAPIVLRYGFGAALVSSTVAGRVIAGTAPVGRAHVARFARGWATVFPGRGRWHSPTGAGQP